MQSGRISDKFSELAEKDQRALICYAVAGYPDLPTSEAVIDALVSGGADMIEIGIPFSDPIADGPTIEAASHAALQKGVKPEDALRLSARLRKKYPHLPLIVMTYSNILARQGFNEFMKHAKECGIDGFIIPDLPVEEAGDYLAAGDRNEISTIFLASPNTKADRLRVIVNSTTGFLYLVSVLGITGARKSFEDYTFKAIDVARNAASPRVPVAVGFGISTPKHVKHMINSGADAVIVGSAVVEIISDSLKNRNKMRRRLKRFASVMKSACKKPPKTH